eukprot:m.56041 g.56041  ORF g.56041 m.56041 type:complete len:328 (-) comp18701_c0_seq1:10-993(-)
MGLSLLFTLLAVLLCLPTYVVVAEDSFTCPQRSDASLDGFRCICHKGFVCYGPLCVHDRSQESHWFDVTCKGACLCTEESNLESTKEIKTIVIGLGTGRCGTHSLAQLLNDQPSTYVRHEMLGPCKNLPHPSIDYPVPPHDLVGRARWFLDHLLMEVKEKATEGELTLPSVVGDIAGYHLPYAEAYLRMDPRVKIVVLKRNFHDTFQSWQRWWNRAGRASTRFPWLSNANMKVTPYSRAPYDRCAPRFDFGTVNEDVYPSQEVGHAVYYQYYHSAVASLMRKYPDRIVLFDTYKLLGDSDVCENKLLPFLNTQGPANCELVHASRTA